ncbi:unnamed protein product [Rotaria sp. Silwood2]|nr:unnamed protein product [Rotaria sp. Silwood2]
MITKSENLILAFNGDNNQCLCIMPGKLNTDSDSALYLTILPNNKCDHYCDNTLDDSKVKHNFKCGSLTDSHIWAIYGLNDLCLRGSIYVKESKRCMFAFKGFSSSCPSPSMKYVFDRKVTWNVFLKIIEKLNLTKSIVSIDFDNDVTIDPSWKCPTTITTTNIRNSNLSNTNYFNRNFSTSYVLDNGCLRVHSNSLYLHILSNHLCIINPMNENSLLYGSGIHSIYVSNSNSMETICPPHWFDINTHCYRISDDRKTIQEARNTCISLSEAQEKNNKEEIIANDDDDDDDDMKKETINKYNNLKNDILKGEIAQYTSQWQVRLGFFLLDTNVSNVESKPSPFRPYVEPLSSLVFNVDINLSSINEFQMINPNEDNNSSIKDDSCLVLTRSVIDEKRSSILNNTQINNCSKPRHVLCRTMTVLGFNSQQSCYSKPLTLGLPAMISNHLTYELCLSVCRKLETNLAVININKCYCFNAAVSQMFDIQGNHAKYKTKECGNPCPGNQHERCGNTDKVVVLHIREDLISSTYFQTHKRAKPYPDFFYDSCIHLNSVNQSSIYQFNLNHKNDVHPRHCLELCKNYKQQYALLNSNKCLCTNILTRKKQYNMLIPSDYNCTQECQGNYFYTCGNTSDSMIYSMYVMQPKCPPHFQVTEDEQRCVHTDFSAQKNSLSIAQSYCKSVGGMLAKINDILEIQDIVTLSTLNVRYFGGVSISYSPSILNDTRFFWIDRTSDIMNNNQTTDRSIGKCFQTSKSIDRNCIVLRREKIFMNNILTYERCFTESDQCSSISAMPVCVDKHLEFNSTAIPPIIDNDSSSILVNISTDYSCGDDTDYHLMNDYCYKVSYHETTWNDAKTGCERDNAMLFQPRKLTTLSLIKSLFLRRHSYTSSGIVHIGIFYDNRNRTATRYKTTGGSALPSELDSIDLHSLCKIEFHQHYERLIPSPVLSLNEKNRPKTQQIRCAYVDFRSDYGPLIACNEISCNRLATAICQKSPIVKIRAVAAKRLVYQYDACGV